MLGNNHLKNLWQRLEWPDKADIQHLQHKQAKVLKLKHDPNIFTFLPYKIKKYKNMLANSPIPLPAFTKHKVT